MSSRRHRLERRLSENALTRPLPLEPGLQVPWLGQREEMPTPEEILASGATLIIVERGTSMAAQLHEEPRFTGADKLLFGCEEPPGVVPFAVYLPRASLLLDPCPAQGSGQKGI